MKTLKSRCTVAKKNKESIDQSFKDVEKLLKKMTYLRVIQSVMLWLNTEEDLVFAIRMNVKKVKNGVAKRLKTKTKLMDVHPLMKKIKNG